MYVIESLFALAAATGTSIRKRYSLCLITQLRQDKIIRNAELSFSCLLIPHKLDGVGHAVRMISLAYCNYHICYSKMKYTQAWKPNDRRR